MGSNRFAAYRHGFECQFGEDIRLRAPFAIAEREDVPNLLGRLGAFDVLRIDFDAGVTGTRVSRPDLGF